MASVLGYRLAKDADQAQNELHQGAPPQLASHPLFGAGGARTGLMTAEAPRFPVTNHGGNKGLEERLNGMGLKFEPTHGSYGGPENSYLIHGASREQLHHLGKEFGQEAVVYGEGGKHELHYTAGPNEGLYHPSLPTVRYTEAQPEDYYTHVPGKGYVTLHFNFDKMLPRSGIAPSTMAKALPPQRPLPPHHRMNFRRTVGHGVLLTANEHAQLVPFAKSELVSVEDIRKALLDGLREVLKKSR